MPDRHCFESIVAFADTDLAGIVHHANYFRYMETAEHDFWRTHGLSALVELDGESYGWPRVQESCNFLSPLRFEDRYRIQVFITEVGNKSLQLLHIMTRVTNPEQSSLVAIGRVCAVCMRLTNDGAIATVTIPKPLRTILETAPTSAYEHLLPD